MINFRSGASRGRRSDAAGASLQRWRASTPPPTTNRSILFGLRPRCGKVELQGVIRYGKAQRAIYAFAG